MAGRGSLKLTTIHGEASFAVSLYEESVLLPTVRRQVTPGRTKHRPLKWQARGLKRPGGCGKQLDFPKWMLLDCVEALGELGFVSGWFLSSYKIESDLVLESNFCSCMHCERAVGKRRNAT